MVFQPDARPRRLIPRFPLTQQVQVRGPGLLPRQCATRDVSMGGCFLATSDPVDLFTDVELDLVMPHGEPVTLHGRVVHIRAPEKAQSAGMPPGIGVQFQGLSGAQLAHVQALVAWARANDTRPRIDRTLAAKVAPVGQPRRAPAVRAPVTQAQAVRKAPARTPAAAPLGAAAQILAQAEAAHAAGKLADATRQLQLLTAMTVDDAKLRARVAQLKSLVSRALADDFEKQAAYEEKQQKWALAARSWQRVAEGRPHDSSPLQRAALAILQANGDLRKALELGKRAVELAENDAQAHRTLARIFVAAGMEANARRELEAAQHCTTPDSKEAATAKTEGGLFKRLLGRETN